MSKDPKIILEILSKNNSVVDDLYRYLYIEDFYKIAYNNIYQKPSQMTKASDGSTIDGMSFERIGKLIQSIKYKSYNPTPLKRVSVVKKSGENRVISIPSFEDKLVQEVIRMILEALYEPHFLDCSHGFRPNRSCHTALHYMQRKFTGIKWWIDADIKDCFDSIDHQLLIKILAERIKEQKFLNLINKFLKAGYLEKWVYHKTYSGTPQGSIISPILTNIYLDKLDRYVMSLIENFHRGRKRGANKEYTNKASNVCCTARRIRNGINVEKNNILLKEQVKLRNDFVKQFGYYDNQDPNFRRMQYVRYADDFLIGVIASREETEEIQKQLICFLKQELHLELNSDKTKIIHNSEKIRFLGYDIVIMNSESRPSVNGKIGLYLPYENAVDLIIKNKFGKFVQDKITGKSKLKAIANTAMINSDDLEILMSYNTRVRGFYHYYKMASNVCKLSGFGYIVQMSFLRTLARKYETSCAKLCKNSRYCRRINGKTQVGIMYKDKFYEYFDGPFTVNKNVSYNPKIDIMENAQKYLSRNSLIKRLEANKCEFCGNIIGPFEVHHIKKIKNIKHKKNKAQWEIHMIERNRKTMVLCKKCHTKLHAGKL